MRWLKSIQSNLILSLALYLALYMGVATLAQIVLHSHMHDHLLIINTCIALGFIAITVWTLRHKLRQPVQQLANTRELEEKNTLIQKTNQELEFRIKELSLLYETNKAITSTLKLNELYAAISQSMTQTLGFQQFAILEVDERRGVLVIKESKGFEGKDLTGLTFAIGEGITGMVASSGKAELVRNVADDVRHLISRDNRYQAYKGTIPFQGSFLSVPIKMKDRVLGVMNFTKPDIDAFSVKEIRLLTTVANQVAIAMDNARLYEQTHRLSTTDALTRLSNRRVFMERLRLEWKRATRFRRPLSILMIDIDNFKRLNDTYGHLMGDKTLTRVAEVLKNNVRDIDLVARYGGEEFVAILPNTSHDQAMLVAEKLRSLVEADKTVEDGKTLPSVTLSIGLANYPNAGAKDVIQLLESADTALYRAKKAGKNQVVPYKEALQPVLSHQIKSDRYSLN